MEEKLQIKIKLFMKQKWLNLWYLIKEKVVLIIDI